MPVVQLNAELSLDQLVKAVTQLPETDFDEFLRTISRIHPLHEDSRLSARESQLLRKINQGIPADMQRRYHELIEKRDAGALTSEEYTELLQLTDRVELLDGSRSHSLLS